MTRVLVPGTLLTLISIVYLFGVAPDMTWMGLAGDSPDYVAAATNFQRAGLGGYPLYITIGWVFEQVFHFGFGFNTYWSLALLSAVSTVVTCGFIYGIIRLYSSSSLPAVLGTLAYASSLLVWTQSVIPEVYTITVMFMVMGVYFLLKEKYYLSAFIFGLSLCTHPLALFAVLPSLVYVIKVTENRPSIIKLLLVGGLGLIPWIQFLASSPDNAYAGLSTGGLSWVLSSTGYIGGLAVFPTDTLVMRLEDFGPILGLGLCIVIPFYILGFRSFRTNSVVLLLGVIALLPILLYVTSTPSQWITYIVPSIAFLAILGGILANQVDIKSVTAVASVCGLGLLGLNLYFYDIGRSVDPSPTTMRQAYEKLDELPSNAVVYSHTWGHMGVLLGTYNQSKDNRLVRVDSTKDKGFGGVKVEDTNDAAYRVLADLYRMETKTHSGKEIYVTYLKDRTKVQFDFVPLSHYRHDLNDVPQFSSADGGRVRIP